MTTEYHYFDFFAKQHCTTDCEVISVKEKTAIIKLLSFGPHGATPGTVMRVHKKSLTSYREKKQDANWRRYCYAE